MGSGSSRVGNQQRAVVVRVHPQVTVPTVNFVYKEPKKAYVVSTLGQQNRNFTVIQPGQSFGQQNPVEQGIHFFNNQNDQQAAQCFLQGIQQDDPAAYFWYGKCCEEGRGVPRDMTLAGHYYKLGAEKGDLFAQYSYACMLCNDMSNRDLVSQAFNLFQASAGQGNVDAQFMVGQFYENGYVTGTPNIQKAVEWYRKAFSAGSPEADGRLHALRAQGVRV